VQSTAGAKQRQQPRGASGQHRLTKVLRHADARNRVIGPVVNVTVVLDADRHTQSLGTYAAPSIVAQFSGDSDTDRLNSVVASSVADEGPSHIRRQGHPYPASARACAPRGHTWPAGPAQGRKRGHVPARSRRTSRSSTIRGPVRRTVADVVVVSDDLRVPAPRMAQPAQPRLLCGGRGGGPAIPSRNAAPTRARRVEASTTTPGPNSGSATRSSADRPATMSPSIRTSPET
jgi:hypothetical protein